MNNDKDLLKQLAEKAGLSEGEFVKEVNRVKEGLKEFNSEIDRLKESEQSPMVAQWRPTNET